MSSIASIEKFQVPARIVWAGNHPLVEMRTVSETALVAAFWDDICASSPISALLPLDEEAEPFEAGPLRGGIFHTYRCGSTLLCRQMSGLPGVYAVAEPNFLSELVLGRVQDADKLRSRILKVLALLAEGLGLRGREIIVKWPGILGDRASTLVAALPDVPMVFLHRNPVEVLASIEQRPLGNIFGAPAALGIPVALGEARATAVSAAVIAHLCRQIAQVPSIRHCDYTQIDPMRIACYFGLGTGDEAQASMAKAGKWYSKSAPGQVIFFSDSAAKRAIASKEVNALARELVGPALALAKVALPDIAIQ